MVRALKIVNEIKKEYKAINKSESIKFKNDRTKYVEKLKKELKQYCYYSDLNYKKLVEYHKI